MEDFDGFHWSYSGCFPALEIQVSYNQTLRNCQIWDKHGKHSIHFAGYWITSFPRYTSQHRDQINTSCAWALSPIPHSLSFFFTPHQKTLLQCNVVGENWMNNLPWETNNIMDPECLLSVMRPNRRLDRRKWCVVLCWDNSPGPRSPSRRLQLRYEVYINHRFVGSSRGPRREREDSQEQGKWVTPKERLGLLRDPQVPCVHACALSLSQHIQIEKALTSKHLEIQDTLEMKYRKLLHKLNP